MTPPAAVAMMVNSRDGERIAAPAPKRFITLSCALVVICVCGVAAADSVVQRRGTSKFVSILVTRDCHAELSEVTDVDSSFESVSVPLEKLTNSSGQDSNTIADMDAHPVADHGMLAVHADDHHKWVAVYSRSGRRVAHSFLDPRLRVGESAHDHHDDEPAPTRHSSKVGAWFQRMFRRFGNERRADHSDKGAHRHVKHILPFGDIHVMHVPRDVHELELYCHNFTLGFPRVRLGISNEVRRDAQAAARRGFEGLQLPPATGFPAGSGADIIPESVVVNGPTATQVNVILLAAGFTASQRPAFDDAVRRVVEMMDPQNIATQGDVDLQNMHHSVPFDRYWPFFNVFKVWQPSQQSGATRDAIGKKVNNNLNCYHPASIERAVTCPLEGTLALAATATPVVKSNPDKTVVVVMVNTGIYGGSAVFKRGSFHVGHFYQGYDPPTKAQMGDVPCIADPCPGGVWTYDRSKFASLVKHEIGHAYGNLFDEYDVGISETKNMNLLNCQYPTNGPPSAAAVNWSYWISIMSNPSEAALYRRGINDIVDETSGEHGFNVKVTPLRVCGYNNYYKPNSHCMMQAVRDYYMCPVCREQATLVVLRQNVTYSWPRSPPQDATMVIPDYDLAGVQSTVSGVVFHLPQWLNSDNDFDVTWKHPSGRTLPTIRSPSCKQCLVMNTSDFAGLTNNVLYNLTVSIVDSTIFVSDIARSRRENAALFSQTTFFQFKIVGKSTVDVSNYSSVNVSRTGGDVGRDSHDQRLYFYECAAPTAWNPAPMCVFNFSKSNYSVPSAFVGEVATYDQWVFYVVGGLGAVFILLWIWAANYYQNKSHGVVRAIFKVDFHGLVSIIRRIMQFAAIAFMVAAVGSLALSTYVYFSLSALGKVVVIAGVALAVALYVMAFIGFWAVAYRSKKLVVVNGIVLYIGLTFLVCAAALVVSIGADINVRKSYWNMNLSRFWRELVSFNAPRACAIQGMLECSGYYLACNSIVGSTEYCPPDCDQNNQQYGTSCQLKLVQFISGNYTYIVAVLGASIGLMTFALLFNFTYYFKLLQMKTAILNMHKRKIEKHAMSAHIPVRQAQRNTAMVLLKSLDKGDIKSLVKEFNRIDTDHSGQLDRKEFTVFFKKALLYNITPQELNEIFSVADLDGDQSISLHEFLLLFNKDAEKVLQEMPGMKGLRAQVDTNRAAEIHRRAASTFGDVGLTSQEIKGKAEASPKVAAYRPPSSKPPDPENLI